MLPSLWTYLNGSHGGSFHVAHMHVVLPFLRCVAHKNKEISDTLTGAPYTCDMFLFMFMHIQTVPITGSGHEGDYTTSYMSNFGIPFFFPSSLEQESSLCISQFIICRIETSFEAHDNKQAITTAVHLAMPDYDSDPRSPEWDNDEGLDSHFDSLSAFNVSPNSFTFD
jgi:hypothetical protein